MVFRYVVLYTIEFLSFLFNIQLKAFRDAIPSILTNWFLLWIGIWYQFKSASGSYLMNIFTLNKPAKESQKLFIRFRHWWHVFYYSPFSWLVKECRLFLFKLGDSFFESENFISLVLYAFFKESLIGTNFMPHKFPRGRHDFLCSLRWRDQEGTLKDILKYLYLIKDKAKKYRKT